MVSYATFLPINRSVSRLNPYCSGRWSRTESYGTPIVSEVASLNPYCSGRWSRTTLDMINEAVRAVS